MFRRIVSERYVALLLTVAAAGGLGCGGDSIKRGSAGLKEATNTDSKKKGDKGSADGAVKDVNSPSSSQNSGTAPGGVVEYRPFESASLLPIENVDGLEAQVQTIRPELADAFCIHVYKLPLKVDVNAELGVLCKDKKPSARFIELDRLATLSGETSRPVVLQVQHKNGITDAVYATAFSVPVPPKWIRTGNIHKHLAQPSKFSYATLFGQVIGDLNGELGGDLQFGKYRLYYRTETQTEDGKTFFNERKTQFDAYQVQGGNPDIGYVTEYLTEANTDYTFFNTTHLTIGNHSGGSVIITVVRLQVKNNGYPDTTAKVINDIMLSQSTNVHDGLMAELGPYVVK
jgi:hypothetical protein